MYDVLGIDISRYQGPWDFVKSVEQGVKYAFIRAGGGYQDTHDPFEDYRFKENARKARDVGLPFGCYWYMVPFNVASQADFFSDLIRNEGWRLPPVMDLEYDGGQTSEAISLAAEKFATRVYKSVGEWPLLYSRSYWLHDHTIANPIWDDLKLWIARYKEGIEEPWGNDGDAPKLKPPFHDDWLFWQWSSEGTAAVYGGGQGDDDVDLNWFHGTQAEFDEYVGNGNQVDCCEELASKIAELEQVNAVLEARIFDLEALTNGNVSRLSNLEEFQKDTQNKMFEIKTIL